MTHRPAAALLPANISGPTAWKALKHVFSDPDWSHRFDNSDPMKLDIGGAEILFEFEAGATMFDYADKARAHVASRVLAISDAMNEADFRHLHFDLDRLRTCQAARDDALIRVRRLVQNRITNEFEARFDTSLSTWVAQVEAQMFFDSPADRLARERFLGLDQVFSDAVLRRAVKYVFDCLKLRIGVRDGEYAIFGKPAFQQARDSRFSDVERERAWSLVIRALDVLVRRTPVVCASGSEVPPTLADFRSTIERKVSISKSWGLIDVVLDTDRKAFRLRFPSPGFGEFAPLLEIQNQRMAMAAGCGS
jgi:hypothetical protein